MRHVNGDYTNPTSEKGRAEIARTYADLGMDTYSDLGVGAAVTVKMDSSFNTYAGFNINMSGMQIKMHAEQLALFQAVLDIRDKKVDDVELVGVTVCTTEDDGSLVCGHCLQTMRAFCEEFDAWSDHGMTYTSAILEGDYQKPEFTYNKRLLKNLLGETYVENRDDN